MKILYQLVASGRLLVFENKDKIHSKRVFTDKQKAENYKEEFKAKCCGGEIVDLDPKETLVYIVELELDEDEKLKTDSISCQHVNVQQFTNLCLDCGHNIFSTINSINLSDNPYDKGYGDERF